MSEVTPAPEAPAPAEASTPEPVANPESQPEDFTFDADADEAPAASEPESDDSDEPQEAPVGRIKPKSPDPERVEKRKYKVKVDDAEEEVDEDELVRGYQSRKSSQKAWQAAAEKDKQLKAIFERIKKDPEAGIEALLAHPAMGGLDFDKIATDRLAKRIEREQMSPEQRELADARAELARRREADQAVEREREEAAAAELRETYRQQVETEISDAVKASDLPHTRFVVKKVVHYLTEGLKRGYKLSAADVLPLVRNDMVEEQRDLFKNLDGEALEKMLGEDIADKLSKQRVQRFKAQPPAVEKAQASRTPKEKPAEKPKTFAEVARDMAKRKWK